MPRYTMVTDRARISRGIFVLCGSIPHTVLVRSEYDCLFHDESERWPGITCAGTTELIHGWIVGHNILRRTSISYGLNFFGNTSHTQ